MTARTDWPQVFADFDALGFTCEALSARSGIDVRQLERARDRSVAPPLGAVSRIAEAWSHVTGKPLAFLPIADAPARVRATPPADSDDVPATTPAFHALDALTRSWCRPLNPTRKPRQ